jgi:hypothetical protein
MCVSSRTKSDWMQYIMMTLRKQGSNRTVLHQECVNNLTDFLHEKTKSFVDQIWAFWDSLQQHDRSSNGTVSGGSSSSSGSGSSDRRERDRDRDRDRDNRDSRRDRDNRSSGGQSRDGRESHRHGFAKHEPALGYDDDTLVLTKRPFDTDGANAGVSPVVEDFRYGKRPRPQDRCV